MFWVSIFLAGIIVTVRALLYRARLRPVLDVFLIFFCFLILIPVGIIYDQTADGISIGKLFGYREALRPSLTPIVFSVVALFLFIAGYASTSRHNSFPPERPSAKRVPMYLFGGGLTATYLILGMFLEGSFPLLAILQGDLNERLRDIAFEFASDTSTTLIFSPQVFGTAYRAVLPFCAFGLLLRGYKKTGTIFLLISIVFCMGSLKRMQLIYLLFSIMIFFTLAKGNNRIDWRLFALGAVSMLFGLVMTFLYSGDGFVASLFRRIFVIEAISEYAAYAVYYDTNPPMLFDLFLEKLRKIIDRDVITFSQAWKEQIASTQVRGFSSVGIFCEFWLSFWWAGLFLAPLFGLIVGRIDTQILAGKALDFWAVAAVIIAAMAMKGVNSQLFSGGLLVLVFAYFGTRVVFRRAGSEMDLSIDGSRT